MIRLERSRRFYFLVALALMATVPLVLSSRRANAGQDAQPVQQQQGQPEQGQAQGQGQSQEKPKKKGGLFGGMKAITGTSSAQTSYTASAGAKGVGEGAQIGDVVPTTADRQAVTQMEKYSVAQGDLSQFIQGGHLKPKQ